MLDNIKAAVGTVAGTIKDVLLYVLTPVLVLGFIIYELLSRNHELEDEIKAKDGNEKLKEMQGEQKQIDSYAGNAVDAFEKFFRSGPRPPDVQDPGGSSDPGPKTPDSN